MSMYRFLCLFCVYVIKNGLLLFVCIKVLDCAYENYYIEEKN